MDKTQIVLKKETVDYIVKAIKDDIANSKSMFEKAQEVGCIEAQKWAEGRWDGAEFIKAVLQVSGIDFSS